MITFLLKGVLRDRSRSVLPIIVTAAGVLITVLGVAWAGSIMEEIIETTAKFQTGHVKVISRAMNEAASPNVIELALGDVENLTQQLEQEYPDVTWKKRISYGGLLDIPNADGDTIAQASVVGMSADIFTPGSPEPENLNLEKALVSGTLPQKPGEIVISDDLFNKLNLRLGQEVTLLTSDVNGSMAFANFSIVGTLRFGISVMDRGAMVADVTDIQEALNMPDGSTEIYGFFKSGKYDIERAAAIRATFSQVHPENGDIFQPVLLRLEDQQDMALYITLGQYMVSLISIILIVIISIVLWNAGLMNGIRRYGEVGIRLAIGESKWHLYSSLIIEAIWVGILGYIIGTALGMIPVYYLSTYGLDISGVFQGSNMMMASVMKTKMTPNLIWIGLIPGVVSPIIGALIAGLGVFKRDTSQLFKELET